MNLPGNVVANLWKPDGFLQLCASYPNKFIPTNSPKLMGPDPRHLGFFQITTSNFCVVQSVEPILRTDYQLVMNFL